MVYSILYSPTKVSRNIFLHDWQTQGCNVATTSLNWIIPSLSKSPKDPEAEIDGSLREIYILSKNILEVVLSTNRSQYSTNKAQRNRKILDIRDTFKQVKNCSSHCFIYCIIFPFRHFPRTFHQNE